jgi:hypothetical protein
VSRRTIARGIHISTVVCSVHCFLLSLHVQALPSSSHLFLAPSGRHVMDDCHSTLCSSHFTTSLPMRLSPSPPFIRILPTLISTRCCYMGLLVQCSKRVVRVAHLKHHVFHVTSQPMLDLSNVVFYTVCSGTQQNRSSETCQTLQSSPMPVEQH